MDRITQAYLDEFLKDQMVAQPMPESRAFELFSSYCVVSDVHDELFDINDVHVAGGNDLGIDGLAIIVNGSLVTSPDDVDGLVATNGYLDAHFMFVQAKSGGNFSGEEIGAFAEGVEMFFENPVSVPMNAEASNAHDIMNRIYDTSIKFTRHKPVCDLYYVTTGAWQEEPYLTNKMERGRTALENLNYFSAVTYFSLGASQLHEKYQRTKNSVHAEISFPLKVVMPDMEAVDEAYLGLLPGQEFLRLITDQNGGIRKSLFYDNVRDFQDYNPVNSEIQSTLADEPSRFRFCVLNNGVTLVARSLQTTGNKFVIQDYQIVNGCQTSHVLFDNRELVDNSVYVRLKIIVTSDDDVTNSVITATNRQTQVTTEDLYALSEFQKSLEALFASYPESTRLYYERRSRQYSSSPVEKVRIITKGVQIRAFAAMFLDDPHRASRYYAELRAQVGTKIFHKDHKLEPYYAAAYGYYRLEYLFRNGQLSAGFKPARYHLLMAFRYLVCGDELPRLSSNAAQRMCESIIAKLWDDEASLALYSEAAQAVSGALNGGELTRDVVRTQDFTDAVKSALSVPTTS